MVHRTRVTSDESLNQEPGDGIRMT